MTSFPPEIEHKIRELQRHIEQADALERAWLVDEAEPAYHACLQMAARERIPLLEGQLAQIWMGIGFCYADRNDWLGALLWYHRAEATLQSAPVFNPNPESPESQANAKKWSPFVPEGVTVIFQQSFTAEAHLAALCDSIALAYDNANQLGLVK
jgi:tetratricopeptide (TPR) repeat protein